MRRVASTVLVALTLLCGSAWAEKPSAGAKAHFASGTQHFDLSEYSEALADFKEAYRLKPDPVFLYNIAQCYRLLKQPEDAIQFYRSYLRRSPDAPNRADVESRIAAMQELIDHPTPPPTAPPPPEPKPEIQATPPTTIVAAPPPRRQPLYKKWWLWTAVGGGLVAIGLGVGLGVGLTRPHAPNQLPGVTF